MKSFTDRVKYNQEKHEGLHVFKVDTATKRKEEIDLICMSSKGKTTFIRARENGHVKLNRMTKMKLQQLGKKCGARVLHASVNGSNEIVFKIIYEGRVHQIRQP